MIGEALTVYRRPPLIRKAFWLTMALSCGQFLFHGGGPNGYWLNSALTVYFLYKMLRRF